MYGHVETCAERVEHRAQQVAHVDAGHCGSNLAVHGDHAAPVPEAGTIEAGRRRHRVGVPARMGAPPLPHRAAFHSFGEVIGQLENPLFCDRS